MKRSVRYVFAVLFILSVVMVSSWCGAIEIDELADRYREATDIQRNEIERACRGQEILVSGTVKNAGEYNFFDEQNDIRKSFYRLVTDVQETPQGTSYQISLLYKNANNVKRLSMGEIIKKYGRLWKLVDDGLWISVWLYGEDVGGELDIVVVEEE